VNREDLGMADDTHPLAVVALGGNALLRRGEPATAANQVRAARAAAQALSPVSERTRLIVTHGNGPQVGLLALKEDAYGDPYPLDVLDAETEGQIGYVIELELDIGRLEELPGLIDGTHGTQIRAG
jgi:carbamate kinase